MLRSTGLTGCRVGSNRATYRSTGNKNSPRKFTSLSWIGAIWRRFSGTARATMSAGKVASDCCIRAVVHAITMLLYNVMEEETLRRRAL